MAKMRNVSSDNLNMGRKITIFFILAGALMQASSFGDIIPANRRIAWSRSIVGVPGGIPNRTKIFADVTQSPYRADKTGTSDASAKIQAAIEACPENQVVYLPAGTYRIDKPIDFRQKKKITLRGAGMSTLLVDHTNGGNAMISIGGDSVQMLASGTAITAGLSKGSAEVTVDSATGFSVGMLVVLSQRNDPALVWSPNGQDRLLQQVTSVKAINGNTITIFPPTYWTWNRALDPRLYNYGGFQAEWDGCEDFRVDRTNGKATSTIFIDQGYACWIKGVRSEKAPNYHFMAVESACLEIRESVAWDSIAHVTNGAGVLFYRRVCSSLVEDNITYRCFPGVEINSGSGGNVIAYNLMEDNYTDQSRLMGASFDCNHGAHTCMDLYEGNVGSMFQSDGYFGSASHITLFRNRFHGTNPTLTDNSKCVDLGRWSQYFNVVGNVLGTAGFSVLLDPTETFPYAKPVIYRLGFPNMGNNGFEGTRPPSTANDALDTRVRATLIRHGNYDFVTKSTAWEAGIKDRELPASLYLSSKPAWFGDLAWPAIGSDLSPMVGQIPAQARYKGLHFPYGG
jgi:Pectate lyase superfamily protein